MYILDQFTYTLINQAHALIQVILERLLFELKHVIYRFYLIEQFVSWNFVKLQKQRLGFVIRIGTDISVTHKEMLCLNLAKILRNPKGFWGGGSQL